MLKKAVKAILTVFACAMFTVAVPQTAEAAVDYKAEIGVETSSSYMVKVDAPTASLYEDTDKGALEVAEVHRGESFEVLAYEEGWALVEKDGRLGYLNVTDCATMIETTCEKVDPEIALRNEVVEYALQFVGNPYRWGGIDPNKGADCSGFTMYVMDKAADVSLSHSSRAQAGEGKKVSEPQAGDLIFYSEAGRINHVAIYIGDGKIVHASSQKTGIIVSPWNRRKPVKIVDVLS